MPRLYQLLDAMGDSDVLTPKRLQTLLEDMVTSHQDCESDHARLRIRFDLLTRRPALVSENLAGWKSYPVCLEALLLQDQFSLKLNVIIQYSSTCPCSAALARQRIAQTFQNDVAGLSTIDPKTVALWLEQHATLATPHSQRSEAHVTVQLQEKEPDLRLYALINTVFGRAVHKSLPEGRVDGGPDS